MSNDVEIHVGKPQLGWRFVIFWIAANLATVLAALSIFTISGGAVTDVIMPDPAVGGQASGNAGLAGLSIAFILTLPTTTLIAGFLQWLVLRWSVPWAAHWMLATFIGVLLCIVVGLSVGRGALGWGILGLLMGLPQWFVIRKSLPGAYWWIVASTLGMALGRLLIPMRLTFSGVVLSGLPQLMVQMLGPVLVWAIVSGITLRGLSQAAATSK